MTISASQVKALRERTGAGMMECKRALAEANGDMEAAVEQMRIAGLAKADKKAGNTAAEGIVAIAIDGARARFAMAEINSQTDFAAKSNDFVGFVDKVVASAQEAQATTVEAIEVDGQAVEEARKSLVAKIGENVQVRRVVSGTSEGGHYGSYVHGAVDQGAASMGRIGVVCELEGGDAALARDVAMHIAASRPVCVDEAGMPAELIEKERSIIRAEAAGSGKPAEIVEKMVQGRVKKYLAEVTLVGQPFVKDPDRTVGKLLGEHGAKVRGFHRFEVGEGIDKGPETNFADEVMAQVRGG